VGRPRTGGALVGHTYDDRIVVTNANGIGIGVETPRGETWMRPARGRWLDFALACGADRYEAGGPKYPRRFASESE
jgi:hypothetical protein